MRSVYEGSKEGKPAYITVIGEGYVKNEEKFGSSFHLTNVRNFYQPFHSKPQADEAPKEAAGEAPSM
jgi:hypothetical protein